MNLCVSSNFDPKVTRSLIRRLCFLAKSAKKPAKTSKNQPPVVPANLLDVNPQYAHATLASGIETNVNIQGIAPHHEPVDENWS